MLTFSKIRPCLAMNEGINKNFCQQPIAEFLFPDRAVFKPLTKFYSPYIHYFCHSALFLKGTRKDLFCNSLNSLIFTENCTYGR
jgi:hypothetical protein